MAHQSVNRNRDIVAYIKTNINRPFKWGEFDCCVFISDCIKIQTGLDLYEPYRGKYFDEQSSLKAQKEIGYVPVVLDSHFNQIDISLIRRGDIVQYENGVMGVYYNSFLAVTSSGIMPVDYKTKKVWSLCLQQ